MNKKEIEKVLKKHNKWLNNETGGDRASLNGASLNGASLNEASLNGASLNGALLNGALLNRALLNGASLSRALLNGALLNRASLSRASLNGASLNRASLDDASLDDASLNGASLNGALLNGALLNRASLNRASLNGASLLNASYSIITILKINWGELPDDLTLELMRHDAEFVGNDKMKEWIKSDTCPYVNHCRDFYFKEKKELWKPGKPKLRGYDLFEALCDAKNIKQNYKDY
jgi:hypothetical protein